MVFAVLVLQGCAGSRKTIQIGKAEPNPELSEQFNNVFQDGDFYFAGIPTEIGLASVSQEGVTVIVNLLPAEQQASRVSFDEPALVKSLGMRYEAIPMVPSTFSTVVIRRPPALIHAAGGRGPVWDVGPGLPKVGRGGRCVEKVQRATSGLVPGMVV